MSELIKREDVQREIQASFDGGAFRWQDGQDLMDRINALPTAQRWVRCGEQLPPNDGKEVLVTDGFHVGIGICMYKWSKTKKWTQEAVWYKWNLNDYGYPMKKFKTDTHIKAWMPLPEPPKEKGE